MRRVHFFLLFLLSGCSHDFEGYYYDSNAARTDYRQEYPAVNALILDYFPTREFESWSYDGAGNEYAAFTRQVVQRQGNLAHVRESSGGAIVDKVYRISGGQVTLVFSEESGGTMVNALEARPNRDQVILQEPLMIGQQWSNGDEVRVVTDTNARVESPGGIHEGCIEIESRSPGTNSTITEFYCRGIGMVQRVFQSGESTVISYLREHSPGQ